MVEIVAADAIDPANRKETAADDRHFGGRDRRQHALDHGAHDFDFGGAAACPLYQSRICSPFQCTTRLELVDVVVDRLEILDPERLSADVGVDRDRHDFRPIPALFIQPVEAVDRALEHMIALVMLHQHHRNVVQFDRIGQRHQRPLGGADHGRLVVIDPVADIFDAGFGEVFRGLQGLRQAGAEPADRPLAGEFFDHAHRAVDHRLLVLAPCGSAPAHRRGP